ncbi:MAG: response regulator [Planctomycetes bacterium]|nr:response regulator [Planctomycetota bacterium]
MTLLNTPALPMTEVPLPPVNLQSLPRSTEEVATQQTIMIVDDEPINIKVAQKFLELEGYSEFVTTTNPKEAVALAFENQPGILLLDIMMPEVSGLDILKELRADERTFDLPVIILTATTNQATKHEALQLGATDFLLKPVDATELSTRVRNCLAAKAYHDHLRTYAAELEIEVSLRTRDIEQAHAELLICLARASEYRDDDTGNHVRRVGRYAEIIARHLDLDKKFIQLLTQSAPLHDIGKIGIPDSILHKPGKLDPEEMELMRKHCGFGKRIVTFEASAEEIGSLRTHADIGAKILQSECSPVLKMASRIALTHHEWWDGTGYPLGLAGEDIPLEGRITAVADVFDALSTKRPYKEAFPYEKCVEIMVSERGTHFEPRLLDAFLSRRSQIIEIQCGLAEV